MIRTGQSGSVAVELVLVTPLLLALMLFVVFAGRLGVTAGDVRQAAGEAARTASMGQTSGAAATAALQTAEANLDAAGVRCASQSVQVDVGRLAPGGSVAVTVTCVADLAAVTVAGLPGTKTFTATAVEVVDTYRGGGP